MNLETIYVGAEVSVDGAEPLPAKPGDVQLLCYWMHWTYGEQVDTGVYHINVPDTLARMLLRRGGFVLRLAVPFDGRTIEHAIHAETP